MRFLLAFALTFFPLASLAQTNVLPNYRSGSGSVTTPVAPETPMPINGATNIPTYSGGAQLTATGAGDIYCIQGSATKTVRVKLVRITGVANAATVVDVFIVRRSSAATGGTAVSVPLTASDSLNSAATATATGYNVVPTAGTAVGTVRARKLAVSTSGNSNTVGDEIFNFSSYYDQPQVLRGTSQYLCVNVTAFGTGASIDVGSEHTEQ